MCLASNAQRLRAMISLKSSPRSSFALSSSRPIVRTGSSPEGREAMGLVGHGRCHLALLRVALFLPRVGVVVVAVALPEAKLVVVEELEPADPLRALPEIALRDQEPERVAVLELERLAVEGVREQDVVVIEDRQRQVRRVALLRVGDDVGRGRPDLGELEDRTGSGRPPTSCRASSSG